MTPARALSLLTAVTQAHITRTLAFDANLYERGLVTEHTESAHRKRAELLAALATLAAACGRERQMRLFGEKEFPHA